MFWHLFTLVACGVVESIASPIYPYHNRRPMNFSHYKILSHTETQFKGLFLDEVTQELKTQIGYNKSVVLTDNKKGEDIIRAYLETSTKLPFPKIKQFDEFKQNVKDYYEIDEENLSSDKLALPSEVVEKVLKLDLDEKELEDKKTMMELDVSYTTISENNGGSSESTEKSRAEKPEKTYEETNHQSEPSKDQIEVTAQTDHQEETTKEANLSSIADLVDTESENSSLDHKNEITEKDLSVESHIKNFDETSTYSSMNQEEESSTKGWIQRGDLNIEEEAEVTTSDSSVDLYTKNDVPTVSGEDTVFEKSSDHPLKTKNEEYLIHDEIGEVFSASDIKENRVRADEDFQNGLNHILEESNDRFHSSPSSFVDSQSYDEITPSERNPTQSTSEVMDLDSSKAQETEESMDLSDKLWNQPADFDKETEGITTEGYIEVISTVTNFSDEKNEFLEGELTTLAQPYETTDIETFSDKDSVDPEVITNQTPSISDFMDSQGDDKIIPSMNSEKDFSTVYEDSEDGNNFGTNESNSREENRSEGSVNKKGKGEITTEGYDEINSSIFNSGSKSEKESISDEITTEYYRSSFTDHLIDSDNESASDITSERAYTKGLFDETSKKTISEESNVQSNEHGEKNSDQEFTSSFENLEVITPSSEESTSDRNSNELGGTFYDNKSEERTYSKESDIKPDISSEIRHNVTNKEENNLPIDEDLEEGILEESSTVVHEYSEPKENPPSDDLRNSNEDILNSIENNKSEIGSAEDSSLSSDPPSNMFITEISTERAVPLDALVISLSNNEGYLPGKKDSSESFKDEFSTMSYLPTKSDERTTHDFSTADNDLEESATASTPSIANLPTDGDLEKKTFEESSTVVYENNGAKQPPLSDNLRNSNEEMLKENNEKSGSAEVTSSLRDLQTISVDTTPSIHAYKSREEEKIISEDKGSSNGFKGSTKRDDSSNEHLNSNESTTPSNDKHNKELSEKNRDEKIMSPSENSEIILKTSGEHIERKNSHELEETISEFKSEERTYFEDVKPQNSSELKSNLSTVEENDSLMSSFDEDLEERTLVEGSTVVDEYIKPTQTPPSDDLRNPNKEMFNPIENNENSESYEVPSTFSDSLSTTYEPKISSDSIALFNETSNNEYKREGSSESFKGETSTQRDVKSTQDFWTSEPDSQYSTTPASSVLREEHNEKNSYSDENLTSPSENLEISVPSSTENSNESNSNELKKTSYETKSKERTNSEEKYTKPESSYEMMHNYSNNEESDLPIDEDLEETKTHSVVGFDDETTIFSIRESSMQEFLSSVPNSEDSSTPSTSEHSREYDEKTSDEKLMNPSENNEISEMGYPEVTSTFSDSFSTTYEPEISPDYNSHIDESSNNEDKSLSEDSSEVFKVESSTIATTPTQRDVRTTKDFWTTEPDSQDSTTPASSVLPEENNEKNSYSDENLMSPSENLETIVPSSKERSIELDSNELEKTSHKTKSEERSYSEESDIKLEIPSEITHNQNKAENDLPIDGDLEERRTLDEGSTVFHESSETKQPPLSDALRNSNEDFLSPIGNNQKSGSAEVPSSFTDSQTTTYEPEISTDAFLGYEDKKLSEHEDSSETFTPTHESTSEESTTPEGETSFGELMGESEKKEIKILFDFKNKTESNESRNMEILTPPWSDIFDSEESNRSPKSENSTSVPEIHGSAEKILNRGPSKASAVDDLPTTTNKIKSFAASSFSQDIITSSEPSQAVTKSDEKERKNYEITTESQEKASSNEEETKGSFTKNSRDYSTSTAANLETPNDMEIKKILWDHLDDKEELRKYEYDSAQNQIEDATRKVLTNDDTTNDLFVSTDIPEHDKEKSSFNSDPETQSEKEILAMDFQELPTTERYKDEFEEASASKKISVSVPYETEANNDIKTIDIEMAPIFSESSLKRKEFVLTSSTIRTDSEKTERSVIKSEEISKIDLKDENNSKEKPKTEASKNLQENLERTTQRYRRTFTMQLPRQKYYEMKLPQRAPKLFWFF